MAPGSKVVGCANFAREERVSRCLPSDSKNLQTLGLIEENRKRNTVP